MSLCQVWAAAGRDAFPADLYRVTVHPDGAVKACYARGWVVFLFARYFSRTDVSNELCATNDYDRETL